MLRASAQGRHLRDRPRAGRRRPLAADPGSEPGRAGQTPWPGPAEWTGAVAGGDPHGACVFADQMNDQQNTLSYVLINPPPDTRLEPNDIV